MSVISKDCYWIAAVVEGEECMVALCPKCNEGRLPASFWKGSAKGYGDYDLKCHKCGEVLHQRGDVYREDE